MSDSETSVEQLLSQLETAPDTVTFKQVIDVIHANYEYTPTRFSNAGVINEAGSNEGSCKIFAFAKLHKLDVEKTLNCFGDYYRVDVLQNPEGTDHGNIRGFMRSGWNGVGFDGEALLSKPSL